MVKFKNQLLAFLKEIVNYVLYGTGVLTFPVIDIAIFANSKHLDDRHHLVASEEQQDPTKPENLPDIEIMPVRGSTSVRSYFC